MTTTAPVRTHLDATHVVRWSHITFDRPVPLISRRDVKPGDTIMSSHGFALTITEATRHGDRGQTTHLRGHIGTLADGVANHSEQYDSSTSVPLLRRGGVTFGMWTYTDTWPEVEPVPAD